MSDMASDSGKEALAERLNVMRHEYLLTLSDRFRKMQDIWKSIQQQPGHAEMADTLYWYAHNLAGSGATYGFPQITTVARSMLAQLNELKERKCKLDAGLSAKLNTDMTSLAGVIEEYSEQNKIAKTIRTPETAAPDIRQGRKLVYLVDDDADFAVRVAEKLRDYGYAVEPFQTTAAFERALERKHPDAIVMDMILQEGTLAGAECIHRLSDALTGIPVVFLSVREDLQSRLSAARSGSYYYFTKPVDMLLLHKTLDHLTNFWGEPEYHVLMVDDDEYLTSIYQEMLGNEGVKVIVQNDPSKILDVIDEQKPDLILLDVNMPGINGLEIGSVIRQFEAYLHIPIVFLTADQDMGKRLASMHLGGDDFLSKSIDAEFLVQVVRTRIEKSRALKSGEQQIKRLIHDFENLKFAQENHSIISVISPSRTIIDANDRFCQISGYTRNELIGKNYDLLKSGMHDDEFFRSMWDVLESGRVWKGQICNRSKHGINYWLDVTTTPIKDEFGVIEKYISIRTDITKLKELEHRLREERERLNLAMEATNTGLWEWNLADNSTYYSERCRSLLKFDMASEISWSELIHPEDFEKVAEQLILHVYGKSEMYASEHRKRNALGGWDWVYECGKIVEKDESGEINRMLGTMQLINERKKLEAMQEQLSRQLLQASKMEAIGHLTSGIAHDFNNMLGGMLGYVELSSAILEQKNPRIDNLQRYLNEIQKTGIRAKELVAQMLIFTRLSQEEGQPNTPIVITPVFKEIVTLLISTIPSTIKLNFHLPIEDIKVAIQPVHLHQIMLNLGINARDSMGEYGEIDLSVRLSTLQEAECSACHEKFGGAFVELVVKDTGSGIEPEIMNRIFDPFFTTKDVGKGSGMGLSVVNGVVHSLGGHICVETSPGKGTAFHVYLRQSAVTGAGNNMDAAGSKKDEGDISGIRILLVDDEHTMAAMLTEFLSMHGAKVSTFTEANAALKEYMQCPSCFDLVITDETMPELSGIDMSREMIRVRPDLPVILCTGFSEYATPERIREAGIAVLMSKPIKVAQLVEHIKTLARQ